jgi:AcrR family transcriptional regulator
MSTRVAYRPGMPAKRKAGPNRTTRPKWTTKPRRKPKKGAYHHGDLERALVDAAVGMIREQGVQAFTLRSVGARVGVSRTAMYRHFDDKAALLARVASEGFRRLHAALAMAIATASQRGTDALQAMAAAYVHFAADNPSHYQTMFGGFLTDWTRSPDLIANADAAFNILVDTIRAEQKRGKIGQHDPIELAEITWSLSHGIATLGMARHLARTSTSIEELAVLGCRFLEDGMRRA